MDQEQPVVKPAPPPEAALIKTGRLASGLGIADAVAILEARGIRISVSRWSQIENGYQTKGGRYLHVSGGTGQVAHMASVSGISVDELAEARPDAAAVLAEILRRNEGSGSAAVSKPALSGSGQVAAPDEAPVMVPKLVAEHWHDRNVRVLWSLDASEEGRLRLVEQLLGLLPGEPEARRAGG